MAFIASSSDFLFDAAGVSADFCAPRVDVAIMKDAKMTIRSRTKVRILSLRSRVLRDNNPSLMVPLSNAVMLRGPCVKIKGGVDILEGPFGFSYLANRTLCGYSPL
jgi:hypothetical protein